MSDDSQITVGAQSELSQSYSQSSVRFRIFTRKFVLNPYVEGSSSVRLADDLDYQFLVGFL